MLVDSLICTNHDRLRLRMIFVVKALRRCEGSHVRLSRTYDRPLFRRFTELSVPRFHRQARWSSLGEHRLPRTALLYHRIQDGRRVGDLRGETTLERADGDGQERGTLPRYFMDDTRMCGTRQPTLTEITWSIAKGRIAPLTIHACRIAVLVSNSCVSSYDRVQESSSDTSHGPLVCDRTEGCLLNTNVSRTGDCVLARPMHSRIIIRSFVALFSKLHMVLLFSNQFYLTLELASRQLEAS
jgi:hypothetical protein